MSDKRPDARLDQLVTALATTRPALDDVARARIAAVLASACRSPASVRMPDRGRRWRIWVAAAATAAAVLAVVYAVHGTARHAPVAAPPARGASPSPSAVAVTAPPDDAELTEGASLLAMRGATVSGQIHHTSLTLYGPGRATRRDRRIIVDADAFVVDRSDGDEPVELEVRTATILIRRATFSAYSTGRLQVTVMRGEIVLRCPDADAAQTVPAGGSATCGPAQAAVSPPEPGTAPPSHAARDSAPPTAPARVPARRPLPRGFPPLPKPHAITSQSAHLSSDPAAMTASAAVPATPGKIEAPPAHHPTADVRSTPPVTDPAPAALPTPTSRYAAAEQLMVTDPAAARAALRTLVTEFPLSAEAAAALLDLARLAIAAGDDVAVHTALDQLAAHPAATSLAMPAAYLRCMLERASPGYRTCLAGFRAAFPGSPRDADALASLAIANARAGDCRAALPLIVEYLQRYGDGSSAAAVRSWHARCSATSVP